MTPEPFRDHPEFGLLPFNTQCDSCIELIHLRTPTQRVFIHIRQPNRIYIQAANGPLHWTDENGWLRTSNPYLLPDDLNPSQFSAHLPEAHILIDTALHFARIYADNFSWEFRLREQFIVRSGATTLQTRYAQRGTHQIGSSGWIETSIQEGISRRIVVAPAAMDVRYYLETAIKNWVCPSCLLIIRDTLRITGLNLTDLLAWTGNTLYLTPQTPGNAALIALHPARLFNNLHKEIARLTYRFEILDNQTAILDIAVPGHILHNADFPLFIDPLVSVTGSNPTICGFSHDAAGNGYCWNLGAQPNCDCIITITGLGGAQLTNAIWNLTYTTMPAGSPCGSMCNVTDGWGNEYHHYPCLGHGWFKVASDACNVWDPGGTLYYTCYNAPTICPNACNGAGSCSDCGAVGCGTCGGTPIANPAFVTCLAPQCNDYTLTFRARLWHLEQCYVPGPPANPNNHYCQGGCCADCFTSAAAGCYTSELAVLAGQFTVTIEGRTVEGTMTAEGQSGSVTVDCPDLPVDLCVDPQFGVPNYTINWYENGNPIGTTSSTGAPSCITANPPGNGTTTTYTAVITDACGNSYTVTVQVTNVCVLSLEVLRARLLTTPEGQTLLTWQWEGNDHVREFLVTGWTTTSQTEKTLARIPYTPTQQEYTWTVPDTILQQMDFLRVDAYLITGERKSSNAVPISSASYAAQSNTLPFRWEQQGDWLILTWQTTSVKPPDRILLYNTAGQVVATGRFLPAERRGYLRLPPAHGVYLVQIGNTFFRIQK